jgi:hypothetical protein
MRPGQRVMPGGRPRMTARDLSAQSLDLPSGKALLMGTMKLMSRHRRMGMRCDLVLPFICCNGEREPFMLIGGMKRRFGSREAKVVRRLYRPGTSDAAKSPVAEALEPASRKKPIPI